MTFPQSVSLHVQRSLGVFDRIMQPALFRSHRCEVVKRVSYLATLRTVQDGVSIQYLSKQRVCFLSASLFQQNGAEPLFRQDPVWVKFRY